MKTLVLILAFTAQQLVSADGTTWKRVAIGKGKTGQFNLWVETPISGSKRYPVVRAKQDTGAIRTLSLDCRSGEFKYHAPDAEWIKAPQGSVGAALIKFACK